MTENRHKPRTANFFWAGSLTDYEAASINSFVKNKFLVNLWTYNNKSFPKVSNEVQIKDATEILSSELLNKLNQNYQRANFSSFSNLFRYKLIEKYGGWWFDTDCYCQKNVEEFEMLLSGRDYILGLERKDYVGSAVMYFNNLDLLNKIQNEAYDLIKKNNFKLKWGEIGPDLITDIVISNGLIENMLDPNYFFPISPNQIQKLFDPKNQNNNKKLIEDSFICHTWNEMFRKYNINKLVHPPVGSFLYNEFEKNGIRHTNDKKIYSKFLMIRFNLVISMLFKMYSRIKVTLKNFKK